MLPPHLAPRVITLQLSRLSLLDRSSISCSVHSHKHKDLNSEISAAMERLNFDFGEVDMFDAPITVTTKEVVMKDAKIFKKSEKAKDQKEPKAVKKPKKISSLEKDSKMKDISTQAFWYRNDGTQTSSSSISPARSNPPGHSTYSSSSMGSEQADLSPPFHFYCSSCQTSPSPRGRRRSRQPRSSHHSRSTTPSPSKSPRRDRCAGPRRRLTDSVSPLALPAPAILAALVVSRVAAQPLAEQRSTGPRASISIATRFETIGGDQSVSIRKRDPREGSREVKRRRVSL